MQNKQKEPVHKNTPFHFLCSHKANSLSNMHPLHTKQHPKHSFTYTCFSNTLWSHILSHDAKDCMCGQATCQFLVKTLFLNPFGLSERVSRISSLDWKREGTLYDK